MKYENNDMIKYIKQYFVMYFEYLIWSLIDSTKQSILIVLCTVECRYKVVQYNMIFHTALYWLMQNINQTLNSHKKLHTSPLRASYAVSIVRIWEKIDHIIYGIDE